jgi:alginate O-acetyltransferase complex protein AlgJ
MRAARADGNYLVGKKVVIWCFSAREFTESAGWQKVPVVK